MTSVRSYDAADNLTQLLNGTTQSFDPANQLISSTTPGNHGTNSGEQQSGQQGQAGQTKTTTYSYDLNGNRVSATTRNTSTTYSFDQANRLTTFNSQATYSYNGDGLRMLKTVGSTTQKFKWDIAEGLPLLLSDPSNQYIYGPGGLPIEQISTSGQVDFFHHDQLGSTRLLTNSKGQAEASFAFDPYGNLTSNNNVKGEATGTSDSKQGPSNSATTTLLFAGQYLDSESGLYYMRARYYDPSTAQLLTRDPLTAVTRSAYGYVAGNPLNMTDPSGNRPPDFFLFNVSPWFLSLTLAVDRYGDSFFIPGFTGGVVPASAQAWAGWVDPTTVVSGPVPSRSDLTTFLSKLSVSASATFGAGWGLLWGNPLRFSNSDFAFLVGIGTPQASGTADYGFPITGTGALSGPDCNTGKIVGNYWEEIPDSPECGGGSQGGAQPSVNISSSTKSGQMVGVGVSPMSLQPNALLEPMFGF